MIAGAKPGKFKFSAGIGLAAARRTVADIIFIPRPMEQHFGIVETATGLIKNGTAYFIGADINTLIDYITTHGVEFEAGDFERLPRLDHQLIGTGSKILNYEPTVIIANRGHRP
ncbi:MAG: hypothetical protein ACI9LO_003024 [Planctomycetota bacterium]